MVFIINFTIHSIIIINVVMLLILLFIASEFLSLLHFSNLIKLVHQAYFLKL